MQRIAERRPWLNLNLKPKLSDCGPGQARDLFLAIDKSVRS
ncbi:uncharacterized protein MEPE_01157 [Melanopsichium pennsylvanicum]|uniref:Uncharacterized protein n=1 Tax=Melanopsichium pennsylvanicum TaxID=63383 RepID=A0AAJ4XIT1_9BASI|nr:uncharacterized protein MEPE_01157 [Melanopsichium pennsylvanicum]